MKSQGKPVITNFNVDLSYSINWDQVTSALSTQPDFWFQNNNGFAHALSGGSYSWVMPTTNDYGIGYLTSFYDAGMGKPTEETVGATYKGFNDSFASPLSAQTLESGSCRSSTTSASAIPYADRTDEYRCTRI